MHTKPIWMRRVAFSLWIATLSLGLRPATGALVLNLDALDPSSLSLDGDRVLEWDSIFGTLGERGPLMAAAGEEPLFDPLGLNGQPTLRFDAAVGQKLSSTEYGDLFAGTDPNTWAMFVIGDSSANPGVGSPFANAAGFRTGGFAFRNTGAAWGFRVEGSSNPHATLDYPDVGGLAGGSGPAIRSVRSNGSDALFFDVAGIVGAQTVSLPNANHDLSAAGPLTVGSRGGTSDAFFGGSISQIVVFDHALSDDEVAGVNHLLAERWQLPVVPAATPAQQSAAAALLAQHAPPAETVLANYVGF